MSDYLWTGWGRPGKCVPIPGAALGTYECLHCERLITIGDDPEKDCKRPYRPIKWPKD